METRFRICSLKPIFPPPSIGGYPRWLRAIAVVALFLCTLCLLVLIGLAIEQIFGMDACEGYYSVNGNWACSRGGRLLLGLATIVILMPPMIIWCRFLQGLVSYSGPTKA